MRPWMIRSRKAAHPQPGGDNLSADVASGEPP